MSDDAHSVAGTSGGHATQRADELVAIGQPLEDDGHFEQALAFYREAIAAAPNHARAHMNAGNALGKLDRWNEGLEEQRRAVECAPDHAPARFNLGAFLFNRGMLAEAATELLEAARLQPTMTEAPVLLAEVYELQERFDDAEAQYKCALVIAPDHPGIMLNLGWFYVRQGQMDDALHWLLCARRANPEAPGIDSQILFAMNFRGDLSPEAVAQEHLRTGARLSRSAGTPFSSWPNTIDSWRRLRVAYVSGDFGPHPVAFFIRPILEHHDRARFEIYGYSNSSQANSIEPALRTRVDYWRTIAGLDDAQVIDQIRRDRIDILVDLSGHTNRGRLPVFARHPAPVQVTWLGYLNTTGLPTMDFRITDSHTDPEGTTEHLHSERLVRLPHSQWCYFAWQAIDPVSRPHPDRPAAIVYGSFNQSAKVTDVTLALWSKVFARVPEAELVTFDVRQVKSRDALLRRMKKHGLDIGRVTVHGRVPIHEYFAALGNVDIALDTFPYNGATTTLDALWMGVPVVGLRGDRGISRGTYSILRSLRADDLIAQSEDAYVELNVRLARDGEWRAQIRETFRRRLSDSPLMDERGFTKALEARYREMWVAWCASQTGSQV